MGELLLSGEIKTALGGCFGWRCLVYYQPKRLMPVVGIGVC